MKELVSYLARALADEPRNIRVSEIRGRHTSVLELRCARRDLGRLIGRGGKTIGAMRTLLSNVAARHQRRAVLEVLDWGGHDRAAND